MNVENHIRHLLFEHDCVIIPHFGGFVGNYKPAKHDPFRHKFTPPSKEISFNKNLTHNDGLLASRVSVEEKISYEDANVLLKKYAEDLKISLKQGKKIEFDRVGILFSDEHQNLRFEPDYTANYRVDSFGLVSFHSPAIKKPETQKQPSLREKTADIPFTGRTPVPAIQAGEQEKKITRSRRAKKYLTYTAAALPLVFFLLWIPFNIEKLGSLGRKARSINYSNLVPFIEKPAFTYMERKEVKEIKVPGAISNPVASLPDTLAFAEIALFDTGKKVTIRLKDKAEVTEESRNSKYRFHVIGGCFQYFENAEKLVDELRHKGYNAAIVDRHRGLYRVCYQSFTSRNEASGLLAKIKSDRNNGAWLLVK